jgi:ubiquinone/menaquinone biosynthesis C-methylase UbiE
MTQKRDYQYDFSMSSIAMHDIVKREKKAATMVAVFQDYFDVPLRNLDVIDVGASTGIIDAFLADHFGSVVGIDIDTTAIDLAKEAFHEKRNLSFRQGDAMHLQFPDESMNVAICSQVYEHVPNARKMMDEIYRILRPGGICYFAASNRLMWNEPHYNLPLLSVIPRPLAHWYIQLSGKAHYYHELHFSYWGLMRLVKDYQVIDYTAKMISNPKKYGITYMLDDDSIKARIAWAVVRYAYWLSPGYIWLLKKPSKIIFK